MKNNVYKLSLLLSATSLLLVACQKPNNPVESSLPKELVLNEDYEEPDLPVSSSEVVSEDDIELDDYDIHTAIQLAYMNSGYNTMSQFGKGQKELSKPKGVQLQVGDTLKDYEKYYLQVSLDQKFKTSKTYEGDSNAFTITNVMIDTTYYYRGAESIAGLEKAKVYSFKTANTLPRNIDIDGITNVRDLGGYESKLGGKIKQGLYYRGGRFNLTDESTTIDQESKFVNELTDIGYDTVVNDLGIKTEIDLRMNESHYQGKLAHEYGLITNETYPDIEYVNFPLNYNYSNMMESEKETIGEIFSLLADASCYPVYLHCNIGTDRTGMCSYLLGTLLGIEQEDLYRDYLFSNFGKTNNSRDLSKILNIYQKTLLSYNEKNLYYDVREYLGDCGVTDKELDNILKLYIEQ